MNSRNQLSRSDRDPAALAVLALLTRGPRHPYDLHRFIVTTRKDFVTGLPRSLYHAVARLEGAGFIESAGTEQAEGRPERTRYALTEAGRAEARRRVTVLLSTPEPDATLMEAALSFMGILQRDEAITALRARAAALDVQRSRLTGDLAEATEVPPLLLVEADFELARLAAEHAWVTGLIDRLESGELAWLDDERP